MAKSAIDSMADYMADPMETAKEGQDQIMKGLESNNFTAKGAAFGSILGRALNGGMDAATQKAAAQQSEVKETLANLAPKGDTESDLDYQLRQTNAIYNHIAPHDPQMAMRVADHIATLSEARSQQKSLEAKTAEAEQETQIKATTQGTIVFTDQQGNNLGRVNRFVPGTSTPNPNYAAEIQKVQAEHPDAFPVTSEKFMSDAASRQQMKDASAANIALIKAQAKAAAGSLDDDTMKGYIEDKAAYGLTAAMSRQPPEVRAAVRAYQTAIGIHDNDLVSAFNQVAAIKSEGVAAARRVGNIDVLSRTLEPLGKALVTAAQNVDRGRLQFVNDMVIKGKLQFQDPNEQRLAYALNAFNTEYARAMSGGVGHTSDSSREDTKELLPAGADLARIKAGVDQVVNKEQVALQQAGDEALEVVANPNKYGALIRVQKALWGEGKGGGLIDFDKKSASAAASPAARPGQASSYASMDEAIAAGHKAGDRVTIGGKSGVLK